MRSLLQFWRVLARETYLANGCHRSTTLDYSLGVAKRRFEHEGSEFLTITLPAFGKDLETCLNRGFVDPHLQFHSWKLQGETPRFLGDLMDRVFDRHSGYLLDEPSEFAIFSLRQLTLLFKKMHLPCDEDRVASALWQYVKTDAEVGVREDAYVGTALQGRFRQMSSLLFSDVFAKLDADVYYNSLIPKHGPGSTADGLTGNGKFYQREWTDRLEAILPYGEYCLPSWRYYSRLDDVHFRSPGDERPVRVITVPKTQETPRLIAIEPTAMQYSQQALMQPLVRYIEADKLLGAVIGFRDQVPNQQLARKGSEYGTLATLDLSEASDRVSYQHVMDLFHRFPFVREAVDACRSQRASVPAFWYHPETVMPLRKFASMGSALTFPFEAMVFTTVIALALQQEAFEQGVSSPLTRESIAALLSGVRVYGDDIIVPTRHVAAVIHYLELFGFKVNVHKSFWEGKFRESCGKEYYDGVDVSISRVRQLLPASRRDVAQIVSTVSLRNQLWVAGFYKTCEHLDSLIKQVIPVYPVVGPYSAVLGRLSNEEFPDRDSWDEDLQIPLVKGFAVVSRSPVNPAVEEAALLKWFLKEGEKPFEDEDHLLRSGRPRSVSLKVGMYPVLSYSKEHSASQKDVLYEFDAQQSEDAPTGRTYPLTNPPEGDQNPLQLFSSSYWAWLDQVPRITEWSRVNDLPPAYEDLTQIGSVQETPDV